MIFVPFAELRKSLFFIYFGLVVLFLAGLADDQIKLKSNIFTPDIIIGHRLDTLSNTNQYFYFPFPRYYMWSCKIKEVLPKIERFPSFPSSLVPFDS